MFVKGLQRIIEVVLAVVLFFCSLIAVVFAEFSVDEAYWTENLAPDASLVYVDWWPVAHSLFLLAIYALAILLHMAGRMRLSLRCMGAMMLTIWTAFVVFTCWNGGKIEPVQWGLLALPLLLLLGFVITRFRPVPGRITTAALLLVGAVNAALFVCYTAVAPMPGWFAWVLKVCVFLDFFGFYLWMALPERPCGPVPLLSTDDRPELPKPPHLRDLNP